METNNRNYSYSQRSAQKSAIRNNIRAGIILLLALFVLYFVYIYILQSANLADVKKRSDYKKEITQLNITMKNNFQAHNDIYMTNKMKKVFTRDDLYAFTNTIWKYSALLDGKPLTSTKATVGSSFQLVVVEERNKSSLPAAITILGAVTRGDPYDQVQTHVSLADVNTKPNSFVPPIPMKTDKTVSSLKDGAKIITTYTFTKTDLKKGQSFRLNISPQLSEKLKLSFYDITLTCQ